MNQKQFKNKADIKVWDKYWQGDRLACCYNSPTGNYDESLLNSWRKFFKQANNQDKILDLCTGNGAIAIAAAETSHKHQLALQINAADQADIQPEQYLKQNKQHLTAINFHGKTNVESLPFADKEFDIITSQFGIEYSNLNQTIPEAIRVLKPNGKVRMIFHAAEGNVVERTKIEIDECDYFINQSQLFKTAEQAIENLWKTNPLPINPSTEAIQRFRSTMNSLAQTVQPINQKLPQMSNPQLLIANINLIQQIVHNQNRLPFEQLSQQINQVKEELEAHQMRMQQLLNAAISKQQVEEIMKLFSNAGYSSLTIKPVYEPSGIHQIGWELVN